MPWTVHIDPCAENSRKQIDLTDCPNRQARVLPTQAVFRVGPTGSGKSNVSCHSFAFKWLSVISTAHQQTHRASGRSKKVITVDGTRYIFVDTPGLDDTYRSD